MEAITQLFQSLDIFFQVFSVFIVIAGVWVVLRGYLLAGILMVAGAALHGLGLFLLSHRDMSVDITPIRSLLISGMAPGMILLTAGICCLAFAVPRRRGA